MTTEQFNSLPQYAIITKNGNEYVTDNLQVHVEKHFFCTENIATPNEEIVTTSNCSEFGYTGQIWS